MNISLEQKRIPLQKGWVISYSKDGLFIKELVNMSGNTEADARAKMLIYLIENKLITL
jgi:hypothetical protein